MSDGRVGSVEQQRLQRDAAAVLAANDAGRWTKPSAAQYPHQWNWDSAFIALGWAWLDWDRAAAEIESLLTAQWVNGMVPHLRYDSANLDSYFPGPDRWPGAASRTNVPAMLTSALSNPPLLVSAALELGRRQTVRENGFYERVYPRLEAWLRWFQRERTVSGCPLIVIVHPWESGWDNSPRWDFLRSAEIRPRVPFRRLDQAHVRADERPLDADYDRYLALIDMFADSEYSLERFRRVSPFVVYDVLVDALWYEAVRALGEMAVALGRQPSFSESELSDFRAAFEAIHWSPELGTYVDHDLTAGRRTDIVTPAPLAGLGSGLVARNRARAMLDSYLATGPGLMPLWTAPPSHPGFDPMRYWRGPVWANVNWLAVRGLQSLGLQDEAELIASTTVDLVRRGGFAEHYSPVDGTPGGSASFSWTAAVTLDLLYRSRASLR